jgi:hypothetical protein
MIVLLSSPAISMLNSQLKMRKNKAKVKRHTMLLSDFSSYSSLSGESTMGAKWELLIIIEPTVSLQVYEVYISSVEDSEKLYKHGSC